LCCNAESPACPPKRCHRISSAIAVDSVDFFPAPLSAFPGFAGARPG
jgi:hypothetical protein